MAVHTEFNACTHNGYITVDNAKTGKHRTFKIWTSKRGALKGRRIVSLLTGPDRRNDWVSFGFANESGVVEWRRFSGSAYQQYAAILTHTDKGEDYGLDYLFEGHCRVCNRILTVPKSIRTGIGPTCATRSR